MPGAFSNPDGRLRAHPPLGDALNAASLSRSSSSSGARRAARLPLVSKCREASIGPADNRPPAGPAPVRPLGTHPRISLCKSGNELGASMPRYYFDLNNGIVPDEEGLDLRDLDAAQDEAARSLGGMARDARPSVVAVLSKWRSRSGTTAAPL
ncbi:DUF6894 family protein [Bradyrhizobium brasilense]|uniref:DUF6894 family protein n=1 Tax=Bradyrhizobium brasilense TaxID=1419277 RepID=UPI003530DFF4